MADITCISIRNGDVIMTIRDNGDQPDVDTVLSREDTEMLIRKLIREMIIWELDPW